MSKNIYVFGEIHSNKANVKSIEEAIRKLKPEYLLHELLYTDLCYTRSTIQHRLDNCKDGNQCDPRLNKDIYQLGYDLNIKLIGIDLDNPELAKKSITEQFEAREKHMCRIIKKHIEMPTNPKIVIVVGYTHLRTTSNNELPISPIAILLKSYSDIHVQRAPVSLQEIS